MSFARLASPATSSSVFLMMDHVRARRWDCGVPLRNHAKQTGRRRSCFLDGMFDGNCLRVPKAQTAIGKKRLYKYAMHTAMTTQSCIEAHESTSHGGMHAMTKTHRTQRK